VGIPDWFDSSHGAQVLPSQSHVDISQKVELEVGMIHLWIE